MPAPRSAVVPRSASVSPATATMASGHAPYGGNAKVSRAPEAAAASRRTERDLIGHGSDWAGVERIGAGARVPTRSPTTCTAVPPRNVIRRPPLPAGTRAEIPRLVARCNVQAVPIRPRGGRGSAGGSAGGRWRRFDTGRARSRPSNRTRPAGCGVDVRCLRGVPGPSRVSPPSGGSLLYVVRRERRTWHPGGRASAARPRWPGSTCHEEHLREVVLRWTDASTYRAARECQPGADLHRCANAQVIATFLTPAVSRPNP